MITANFSNGSTRAYTQSAYQYDKGQYLAFEGIEVLAGKEVHFANTKDGGISVAVKFQNGKARIPDAFFNSGDYIYAWVYAREIIERPETQTSNEEGSSEQEEKDKVHIEVGQTLYEVIIPIIKRPVTLHQLENGSEFVFGYDVDGENMFIRS